MRHREVMNPVPTWRELPKAPLPKTPTGPWAVTQSVLNAALSGIYVAAPELAEGRGGARRLRWGVRVGRVGLLMPVVVRAGPELRTAWASLGRDVDARRVRRLLVPLATAIVVPTASATLVLKRAGIEGLVEVLEGCGVGRPRTVVGVGIALADVIADAHARRVRCGQLSRGRIESSRVN